MQVRKKESPVTFIFLLPADFFAAQVIVPKIESKLTTKDPLRYSEFIFLCLKILPFILFSTTFTYYF